MNTRVFGFAMQIGLAGVVSAVGLCSCASAPAADASAGQRVVVSNTVIVSFTEAQDRLPFNPRAARLQEATEQMTKIAGHAIELRFDAALLPEFRASFEEALTDGVENIARDLAEAKEREPRIFEYAAPLIKRVFCKYDAVVTEDDAEIDAKTGEVTITMPVRSSTLIPRGAIHAVMEDAFDDELDRRFSGVEPERADDLDSYFEYLTESRHARRQHRADLSTQEGLANDPRAVEIDRIARLSLRVPRDDAPKSLSSRIEKTLVNDASYFVSAYHDAPTEVQRAPQNTAFRRAEASYVAWLSRTVDKLDPKSRAEILRTTAVLPYSSERKAGDGTYLAFAFPGFDWLGASLHVVDAWIAAGHPLQSASPRAYQDLYDELVCPYPRDEHGVRRETPRCNDHLLYEYAFAMTAQLRQRFMTFLLAKKDSALTETTFLNLLHLRGENRANGIIAALRAIDSDGAQWNVAANVIGEELAADAADARLYVDEAARVWRAHPDRRGAALFILAEVDRHGNDKVPWTRFPASFGAPISQAEFASYLNRDFRALSDAHELWPALGKFSRADVIVPRLDAYLDDPRSRQDGDTDQALRDIVRSTCDEGNVSDLAKFHGYFQSRIAFHVGDAQRFAGILNDTRDDKCKPKPKPRASKKTDTSPDPFAPQPPPQPEDEGQPFGPPGN